MLLKDLMDLVNKEKRQKERVKVAKYAIGMVAVAAAGVAIGVIFAPKSGKETREDLKKKAVKTEEIIKTNIKKKEDAANDSISQAAKEAAKEAAKGAHNEAKEVHEETKGVKKNV
jgi:hypothetical protein